VIDHWERLGRSRRVAEHADLLARPQRLHAGGDDDVVGVQPLATITTGGVVAHHLDVAQRDGARLAGRPPRPPAGGPRGSAPRRGSRSRRRRQAASADDGGAEPHPGRLSRPTRTWNVPVTGSACGETSRTRPVVRTRVGGQRHRDHRVRRGAWIPAPARRTPRRARRRAPPARSCGRAAPPRRPRRRGRHAAGVADQLGVGQPRLGDADLRRGGIDRGLRGLARLRAWS
jgi:hypothetical protein